MPEPVDLSYVIGLEPSEAVAYFRQKGYEITWAWYDMWQEAHAKAFTVAKAMKLDLLQDIRASVDKALAQGLSFAQFQAELEPILRAKGWWGRILSDEGKPIQLGSPYRLQTIFRTNLQSAYMAGRYKQQIENADDRPYWQYVAVMDSRTRPEHAMLNGKVFRFDDPFWNTHYPPLGFRCRCRVRALTAEQVKARGLTVESGAGRMVWEEKPAGKDETPKPVAAYVEPITGLKIFTDPGWSYNPGQTAWAPDLGKYEHSVAGKWNYPSS